jgi:glycosyltransferase involved in cell wall biosynthesis
MIVPPNDASALAEGIRELLKNEELRLTFVRRASDRVQLFARGRIVEIFESALREVAQT